MSLSDVPKVLCENLLFSVRNCKMRIILGPIYRGCENKNWCGVIKIIFDPTIFI